MNPEVKRLLKRNNDRIAAEDKILERRLARTVIAHIDFGQSRDGEPSLESHLVRSNSGSLIIGMCLFFGAMTITCAIMMRLFA